MRRFLVKVYMQDNGKKIEAIKNVRAAFGIGLLEAKNFVETNDRVVAVAILNGDQVAKLLTLHLTDGGLDFNAPYFRIDSLEEIKDTGIDFSASVPF